MTHQETDIESDYHSITKPAFGKDEWDHDYYEFVDEVDSNLKLSGAVADRPSASNAPGNSWYEATDQDLIYRNDPSNGWVVIGHGSQSNPVPEGHYDSLSTEAAAIGAGSPVSGIWGDSGERVLLFSGGSAGGGQTTTSTTYTFATDAGPIDFGYLSGYTNISQLYVRLVGELTNDTTGETTYVRAYDITNGTGLTGTETTTTGTGNNPFFSSFEPYSPGGVSRMGVEFKVSGGTGTIRSAGRIHIEVWGEIQ